MATLGKGYVATQPGDALNVNPEPGINWIDKYGSMDWGNALKTGDFGLTDAERATQLANTVRINNEEMAKAQAARAAAAAQVSQAPPRMPAPIQGPMRQGGSYPYQIPNRTFEWSTTPQEQMALAGRMNRQDLQPLLGSGEYGPLAGQNYRYTPQGTTQINYGPGGGGGYDGFPPWQGLPPWQPPVPPTISDPPPRPPVTIVDPPPRTPPETTSVDKPFIWDDVKNLTGPEFIDPKDWRGPEAGWGTTPGQQIGRAVVQPGGGIKFGGLNAGEIKAINDATQAQLAKDKLAGYTTGFEGGLQNLGNQVDDFSTMGANVAETRANELRARQQQAIMNMENQRRAQAQATARAARAATSRGAALPPTVRAAQERAANQRQVEQASQQQRQAEMQRRSNQQQAQQQRESQAAQQREQAARNREATARKQQQSRAKAASKAAADRAQQARVAATERSKRDSARAAQAAAQRARQEAESKRAAARKKQSAPPTPPKPRRVKYTPPPKKKKTTTTPRRGPDMGRR